MVNDENQEFTKEFKKINPSQNILQKLFVDLLSIPLNIGDISTCKV